MAERSRRVRRQISDEISDESEGSENSSQESEDSEAEDYDPRRSDAMRRAGRQETSAAAATTTTTTSSRSKRNLGPSPTHARSRATVQRSGIGGSDDKRQSLKLTVKAPPSKLREVMRANEIDSLQDTLGGGQVIDGPRSRRSAAPARASNRRAQRPKYAEFAESDIEDEEEEEEDEADDMDDIGEAEGGTDDEDVEMEDAPDPPKAPKITLKPPSSDKPLSKPKLVITPAKVGPVKSVEDQEMQDDPGDEEVEDSSEDSEEDDEDEEEEGDETNLNEEDAEGEDEEPEEDVGGEEEELEDDSDSDEDSDETPLGSGAGTPDPAKLTKRQMRRAEDANGLMALDMAPQQRKFFTDAEKAMKKDEHARKRKELTKRKIQEEKTAALNRLLKPQASKTRGAVLKPENLAKLEREAAGETSAEDEDFYEKAHPLYTRWISNKDGIKLGVPEEWLDKRVGSLFAPSLPPSNGSMVQELD